MNRLLQLGTFLLILVGLAAPLSECFDRWDPPGLANDVEFAFFVVVMLLALVLIVSKLIATLALFLQITAHPHLLKDHASHGIADAAIRRIFVPSLPPPLRI